MVPVQGLAADNDQFSFLRVSLPRRRGMIPVHAVWLEAWRSGSFTDLAGSISPRPCRVSHHHPVTPIWSRLLGILAVFPLRHEKTGHGAKAWRAPLTSPLQPENVPKSRFKRADQEREHGKKENLSRARFFRPWSSGPVLPARA